jgi:hypothetical protein
MRTRSICPRVTATPQRPARGPRHHRGGSDCKPVAYVAPNHSWPRVRARRVNGVGAWIQDRSCATHSKSPLLGGVKVGRLFALRDIANHRDHGAARCTGCAPRRRASRYRYKGHKMRILLLVATGMAATTLQLAYSQDGSTSRRDEDTELFYRGPSPSDPHYARVDRFDQIYATHSSPGGGSPYGGQDVSGTVPDHWWTD